MKSNRCVIRYFTTHTHTSSNIKLALTHAKRSNWNKKKSKKILDSRLFVQFTYDLPMNIFDHIIDSEWIFIDCVYFNSENKNPWQRDIHLTSTD